MDLVDIDIGTVIYIILLIPACAVAVYLFSPLVGVTFPFVGIGITFGFIDLGYGVGTNILVGLGFIVLGVVFFTIGEMMG